MLPINLSADVISQLAEHTQQNPQQNRLLVDLEQRSIRTSREQAWRFEIKETDAEMLLNGWDPIALTLRLEEKIEAFRAADRKRRPWIYLA